MKLFEAHVGWRALRSVRTVIVLAAVIFGTLLAAHPAAAGGGTAGEAAAVGNAGTGSCSNSAGKALYDCLAGVMDRMSNAAYHAPEAQRALQAAASQLRAAANKAQALSAVAACRSAIGAIMQRLKSGDPEKAGLTAITGVLATAARLIQAKG